MNLLNLGKKVPEVAFCCNASSVLIVRLSWFTSQKAVTQPAHPHGGSNNDPFKSTHGLLLGGRLLFQGGFNFLVRLVLAEGIHRPDRGGQPADQGDLQDQAEQASKGPTYREEGQGGEEKCDQKSHRCKCVIRSVTTQVFLIRLTSSFWWLVASVSQVVRVLFLGLWDRVTGSAGMAGGFGSDLGRKTAEIAQNARKLLISSEHSSNLRSALMLLRQSPSRALPTSAPGVGGTGRLVGQWPGTAFQTGDRLIAFNYYN
jgi:hypothetical protein